MGATHTCATLSTGELRCWGNNGQGQCAQPGTATIQSPTSVSSLSNMSAVSTLLNNTCALVTSGALKFRGSNVFGRVGNGSSTAAFSPVSPSDF